MTVKSLDPISLPLHSVCLIEASAGTGKTHTIASLYLRLLLQAGKTESNFPRALTVEEILVVTFTEMATEELKERIRSRIYATKQALLAYRQQDTSLVDQDPLLQQIVSHIADIDLAITRLTLAEQNFDLAAIFTIHGFCRRVLMQYAFNSGIAFDLKIVTDERDILQHLTNEIWRENFYRQSLRVTEFLTDNLGSPVKLLKNINNNITNHIAVETGHQPLLNMSLGEFLNQLDEQFEHIEQFKQQWLDHSEEIQALFAKHKANIKLYDKTVVKRFPVIDNWAKGQSNTMPKNLPQDMAKYISQQGVINNMKKGQEPFYHPFLEKIDQFLAQSNLEIYKTFLFFHCRQALQQKVLEHKIHSNEKGFDDLLRLVKEALYAEQGDELAALIRYQYPFAMIDEFQDTDLQQYQIFSKIYMQELQTQTDASGFLMIGDPKQSIYKFRGADIFTYLKAAEQAKEQFTLEKNWRSSADLIDVVNGLFNFSTNPPFVYENIQFLPVQAARHLEPFEINGQVEPACRVYIQQDTNKETLAQHCATSIQSWLQNAEYGKAKIGEKAVQAKNIAVLVRSGTEAQLVKNALLERGINAVFLSDKSNIFQSEMAKDMLRILSACLDPNNERKILNALASRPFGLNSENIIELKQSEQKWEDYVLRFMAYQKIWLKQGVLPMLHQILMQEKIGEYCDERQLTDYLHLAELLQQASRLNETEAALYRWFEKSILSLIDEEQTEQIRLESDRELVKIVTYHKSKGLAYDLVWLPFLGLAEKNWRNTIDTYYDEKRQEVVWNLDGQQQELITQESYAESLRLLYVALTRAKYQVVLALPENFEEKWNALLYVLTQGEIGLEQKIKNSKGNSIELLEKLQSRVGEGKIILAEADELYGEQLAPKLLLQQQTPSLHLSQFNGQIERHWSVASFTSITRQHHFHLDNENNLASFYVIDEALDYDNVTQTFSGQGKMNSQEIQSPLTTNIEQNEMLLTDYAPGYSPFDFPRGANVGTLLHRYFEHEDFQQGVQENSLNYILERLQLAPEWQEPLSHWLQNILTTPLLNESELKKQGGENFCLQNIPQQDCLKEMGFFLKIGANFSLGKFNQALKKYHHLTSESLQLEHLQGMLRGFVDLVFRHQGKYYLLDYKSNFLGDKPQDYTGQSLTQAISDHHYDWQYLLYTLALHRYLQIRDPNYNYQQHFGGVFYTFLRGMDGQTNNGIFFDKPAFELIASLQEIFQC